jgi:hypothetical protein
MNRIIAYCGINCSECPAYLATQKDDKKEIKKIAENWSSESMSFKPEEIYCDGCNVEGRHFSWCENCDIRICCKEKQFPNCAYCEDFICDKLKNSLEKDPSAKQNLEEIRNTL